MAHFDDIYEIASDNFGLATAAEARDLGITKTEIKRWVDTGRLTRRGHGLYKLVHYTPTEYDRYAEAVALVGPEAYLYGESVLAMHNLALVNPAKISVATKKRVRRKLPEWVKVVSIKDGKNTAYEGIPSQSIADAIRECEHAVMGSRLLGAVEEAKREGLINASEYEELKGRFGEQAE